MYTIVILKFSNKIKKTKRMFLKNLPTARLASVNNLKNILSLKRTYLFIKCIRHISKFFKITI